MDIPRTGSGSQCSVSGEHYRFPGADCGQTMPKPAIPHASFSVAEMALTEISLFFCPALSMVVEPPENHRGKFGIFSTSGLAGLYIHAPFLNQLFVILKGGKV
jgi:hypothetical protein